MFPSRRILVLSLALALIPTLVHAGVPSPTNSTLGPCIHFCPLGDLTFSVTVRDIANVPVASSTVVLDFSQCASFVHCAQGAPYTYSDANKTVSAVTNASGVVSFALKMGGSCASVRVIADGVILGNRAYASTDPDGSLDVHGDDTAAINAALGTGNTTRDLDCDGTVTANDVLICHNHEGHTCVGVVPTLAPSWGMIKIRYR